MRPWGATFQCVKKESEKLLVASGQNGVYYRYHETEHGEDMELLWLPATVDHETASEWAAQDKRVYGLAEKAKTGRYALRFKDLDSCLSYAKDHNMEDEARQGRWQLTGLPVVAGVTGLTKLLRDLKWTVTEILYFDDQKAHFLATNIGERDKKYVKYDEAPSVLRFQALNEVAKRTLKDKVEQERKDMQPRPKGKGGIPERRRKQQAFIQTQLAEHTDMETEEDGKDGIRANQKRPSEEGDGKGANKSARLQDMPYKGLQEKGLQAPLPTGTEPAAVLEE